jgi:AraC family transcriptional regulator of arabinose operon
MAESLHNPAAHTLAPPPGILISGHFREPFGYRVYRAHGTRDWLITFTIEGEGVYRVADRDVSCLPGDVAILTPGTPHDYFTPDRGREWEFVWAHFVPREPWLHWLKLPETERGFIRLPVGDDMRRARIRAAFERLIVDSRGIGNLHEELALNAMEEIILLVAQTIPGSDANLLDPRVEEALQTMARRLAEPLNVAALAEQACLSPSRFSHLFKKETGDSVMETLQKMRLRESARLLEFTSRRIADIANDVGYSSAYYFSRQFSKYFGMSPTAYRELTQGNKDPSEG